MEESTELKIVEDNIAEKMDEGEKMNQDELLAGDSDEKNDDTKNMTKEVVYRSDEVIHETKETLTKIIDAM